MLRKPNILIRLIAIIVAITFSFESILWANPEILHKKTVATTLQVLSPFDPANLEQNIQMRVMSTLLGVIHFIHTGDEENITDIEIDRNEIESFNHSLRLIAKDTRINFNFDKEDANGKYKEDGKLIVPCAIETPEGHRREYEAVIYPSESITKITLREPGEKENDDTKLPKTKIMPDKSTETTKPATPAKSTSSSEAKRFHRGTIGSESSSQQEGKEGLSRRKFLSIALLSILGLGRRGLADQKFEYTKGGTVNLPTVEKQARTEVINLLGSRQYALKARLLDPILVAVEALWDSHPRQEPEIKKGLRLGKRFEFAAGHIYHGGADLDNVLLENEVKGELFFTRSAHEWAIGSFTKESKSPAIFVLDTQYFNNLTKTGHSELHYAIATAKNLKYLDPYPKADSFSLDRVKEIWVSEETYVRYQRIIIAAKPSDLPVKDRPLMAVQDKLRKLFNSGKIKNIPGLRHTELPRGTRAERVMSYATAHAIVGQYMKDRALFQYIPFFKIEGEKNPFENMDMKAFASEVFDFKHKYYRGNILKPENEVLKRGTDWETWIKLSALWGGFLGFCYVVFRVFIKLRAKLDYNSNLKIFDKFNSHPDSKRNVSQGSATPTVSTGSGKGKRSQTTEDEDGAKHRAWLPIFTAIGIVTGISLGIHFEMPQLLFVMGVWGTFFDFVRLYLIFRNDYQPHVNSSLLPLPSTIMPDGSIITIPTKSDKLDTTTFKFSKRKNADKKKAKKKEARKENKRKKHDKPKMTGKISVVNGAKISILRKKTPLKKMDLLKTVDQRIIPQLKEIRDLQIFGVATDFIGETSFFTSKGFSKQLLLDIILSWAARSGYINKNRPIETEEEVEKIAKKFIQDVRSRQGQPIICKEDLVRLNLSELQIPELNITVNLMDSNSILELNDALRRVRSEKRLIVEESSNAFGFFFSYGLAKEETEVLKGRGDTQQRIPITTLIDDDVVSPFAMIVGEAHDDHITILFRNIGKTFLRRAAGFLHGNLPDADSNELLALFNIHSFQDCLRRRIDIAEELKLTIKAHELGHVSNALYSDISIDHTEGLYKKLRDWASSDAELKSAISIFPSIAELLANLAPQGVYRKVLKVAKEDPNKALRMLQYQRLIALGYKEEGSAFLNSRHHEWELPILHRLLNEDTASLVENLELLLDKTSIFEKINTVFVNLFNMVQSGELNRVVTLDQIASARREVEESITQFSPLDTPYVYRFNEVTSQIGIKDGDEKFEFPFIVDILRGRPGHWDSMLVKGANRVMQEGEELLDLACGNGMVSIAMAPKAKNVIACDIDDRSVELTIKNVSLNERSNVEVRQGDLFVPVEGKQFDVITCSPPAMPTPPDHEETIANQSLTHEGGPDGWSLIGRIIPGVPKHLKSGGRFVLVYMEFLGYEKAFASMREAGLIPEILFEQEVEVKPDSDVDKRKKHIEETLGYKFIKRNGKVFYKTAVIVGRKPLEKPITFSEWQQGAVDNIHAAGQTATNDNAPRLDNHPGDQYLKTPPEDPDEENRINRYRSRMGQPLDAAAFKDTEEKTPLSPDSDTAEGLSKNWEKSVFDTVFSGRKVIAAFHRDLGSVSEDHRMLIGAMEAWKKRMKRKFANLPIDNFIIIKEYGSQDELRDKLINGHHLEMSDLSNKRNIMLTFALENTKPIILGSIVQSVYLKGLEDGQFSSEQHYWPIIEVMTISVVKAHTGCSTDAIYAIFEKLGIGKEAMESQLNIADIKERDGALIVTIIGRAEKHDLDNNCRNRHAFSMKFLKAA